MTDNMDTIIVIPARYASTRLPGKVLSPINGRPMIEYVWKAASAVKGADILIATDDKKVVSAVEGFGARCVLTAPELKSGSDRVMAALELLGDKYEYIVNLQADEPLIEAKEIEKLIDALKSDEKAQIATLYCNISEDDALSPNNVKVVFDREGYALYFSRSIIPYYRDRKGDKAYFKHIGIYAYSREGLMHFSSLDESSLERSEKLEQLRALENGIKIKVCYSEYNYPGVDTLEDLKKVEDIIKRRVDA